MSGNSVHCPHCSYTTAIWVTGKNTGYRQMSDHVADAHAEEYIKVRRGLDEIDEDIRRAEEQAEQT